MKHALKLTAMLAAVLMLAACNKEKELTPDTVATTQVRDITYTVADRTTTVHLETDTEFEALLVQFCNYAQQGDSVTFYNANRGNKGVAAKDVATYSTTNREEMIRWMRQMEEAGKTVTVTYDPNTGSYNGMAYTTAPTPDPQDTVPPAPTIPDFVGLDPWLNGTTWAVQGKEYLRSLSDDYSWRQFRQEYTPQNFTDRYISGTDLDTFYFYTDTTYRISGSQTVTGTYGLSADSVGTLDGYKRLYQISADSMIVYNWKPLHEYIAVVESWLFTKVQ